MAKCRWWRGGHDWHVPDDDYKYRRVCITCKRIEMAITSWNGLDTKIVDWVEKGKYDRANVRMNAEREAAYKRRRERDHIALQAIDEYTAHSGAEK